MDAPQPVTPADSICRTPDVPKAKLERLQTRPQFQVALAGRTVSKTAHFALHRAALPLVEPAPEGAFRRPLFGKAGIWLGAMVPKRWAKRAVTRNAIKRQIYAISAEYALRLKPQVHVVRLRSSFDPGQFISARSERLRTAVRAELFTLLEAACEPLETSRNTALETPQHKGS